MLEISKSYKIFQNYISEEHYENTIVFIDFALALVKDIIKFYNGKEFKNLTDINQVKKLYDYEGLELLKSGAQTLFITILPAEIDFITMITIKPYKIKSSAIVHFLASVFLWEKNLHEKIININKKTIIIRIAKPLLFDIFKFSLGKVHKEIPILVTEGIESKFYIRDYLSRSELSSISKTIAKENKFSFDSYPSNWKIVELSSDNKTITIVYVDLIYSSDYSLISPYIKKILSNMGV